MASNDNTTPETPKAYVFNVNLHEGEASKLTDCIHVQAVSNELANLGSVRKLLTKEKKLDSAKARLSFCTKDGAHVKDHTTWDIYKLLVEHEVNPSSDEKKDAKNVVGDVPLFNIYLDSPEEKKTDTSTSLSESAKKVLESDLDLDLVKNKPELVSATLKELSQKYKHANFKAAKGGDVVTASSLSENDWATVLKNTQYLNGHRAVFGRSPGGSRTFQRIDRAPYTAFKLAPRAISQLETADNSIKVDQTFQIPRYVVTDDSYVNVFETANALSSSVASSSFSQTDIEGSLGGSLFGVDIGVKAGFAKNESNAIDKSKSTSKSSMNITYNFPRAILHLDPRSLVLTEECKKAIDAMVDQDDLIKFHRDFGHFFATNVELGGKLFSSEQLISTAEADKKKTANALKVSAKASFAYGLHLLGGEGKYEKQEQGQEEHSDSRMQNSLSWEAQGGDTILCNDPGNWCPTVKPFNNWRVINQKDVIPLIDFIGMFDGFKHIPERVERIAQGSKKVVPCKFRLRAEDKDELGSDKFYGFRNYGAEIRAIKWYLGIIPRHQVPAVIEHEAEREMVKYTDSYSKSVGIGTLDNGCDFEVDVETVLNQPPEIQLNTPYRIRNMHSKNFLCGRFEHRESIYEKKPYIISVLFYTTDTEQSSKFMFREPYQRDNIGKVNSATPVELVLCNSDGKPEAVVMRPTNGWTLLPCEHDWKWVTSHNARVEYIF